MIFARLEMKGFNACGLFSSAGQASDLLIEAAEASEINSDIGNVTFQLKQLHEMSLQDELDCDPDAIGKVFIL